VSARGVEWRPRAGGKRMRHAFLNGVALCVYARASTVGGMTCTPFGLPDPHGATRGVQTCDSCLAAVRRLAR
jgi:hypothetical protein